MGGGLFGAATPAPNPLGGAPSLFGGAGGLATPAAPGSLFGAATPGAANPFGAASTTGAATGMMTQPGATHTIQMVAPSASPYTQLPPAPSTNPYPYGRHALFTPVGGSAPPQAAGPHAVPAAVAPTNAATAPATLGGGGLFGVAAAATSVPAPSAPLALPEGAYGGAGINPACLCSASFVPSASPRGSVSEVEFQRSSPCCLRCRSRCAILTGRPALAPADWRTRPLNGSAPRRQPQCALALELHARRCDMRVERACLAMSLSRTDRWDARAPDVGAGACAGPAQRTSDASHRTSMQATLQTPLVSFTSPRALASAARFQRSSTQEHDMIRACDTIVPFLARTLILGCSPRSLKFPAPLSRPPHRAAPAVVAARALLDCSQRPQRAWTGTACRRQGGVLWSK